MITDLSIERLVLSALINNPNLFAEKSDILKEHLFSDKDNVNKTIFNVAKNFYMSNKDMDVVLIYSTVKGYGVSFSNMNDSNLEDYIKGLYLSKVSFKAGLDAIDRLHIIYASNILMTQSKNVYKYVEKNALTQDLQSIVENSNSIFGNISNLYNFDEEPEDITHNIAELLKNKIENPQEELGLMSPYKIFNETFGGFRNGNVYAFVARPKHGKTTWLVWLSAEMCKLNDCKVLYLDTEMDTDDVKFRTISAYSKVPMWNIETGNVSEEQKENLRAGLKKYKNSLQEKFFHKYCVGKTTDQIVSIIKRWIMKNIKTNDKFFIVYDYIKLTGEKTSSHNQEHQIIGEKVNALKSLSAEFNFPLLTACQLNREAEKGNDDSSAIAQSDRLQWFASFVAILRRKREEELKEYGDKFGSHLLIPLATRFQGKNCKGHTFTTKIPVRTVSGKRTNKFIPYFINYDINNFAVSEMGDSEHISSCLSNDFDLQINEHEQRDASF